MRWFFGAICFLPFILLALVIFRIDLFLHFLSPNEDDEPGEDKPAEEASPSGEDASPEQREPADADKPGEGAKAPVEDTPPEKDAPINEDRPAGENPPPEKD